mmetsp:Transcript_30227/g.64313  ORF Transcript_30227/g.64313 Transcript_30227/m.64313 type:complete len:285 (-) Transcript_30227:627-1481(-)
MHVAADEKVDTTPLREVHPEGLRPSRRKVRDDDLPVGSGLSQLLVDPGLLLFPKPRKPTGAILDAFGTFLPATDVLRVVCAADVVLGIGMHVRGVEDVGVQKEIINRETRIANRRHPELRRHDPSTSRPPGVADELVPALVKEETAIVVVPQNSQPRLTVQPVAFVDVLEVPLELSGRNDLVSRYAASSVDAAPVEVVADVQDVVRAPMLCPNLHLARDSLLGLLIGVLDALLLRPLHRRLGSVLAHEAAPVTDDVDTMRSLCAEAGVWQVDAVEVCGEERWLG